MSDYNERVSAFANYGMGAIDRLVQDNAELFLSIDEKDVAERIVALTRLRSELPAPTSEDEAYDLLAMILGELLHDGRIKVAAYGLSTLGHNQYQALVRRASGEPLPKPSPYMEIIHLYKTNISEFNNRRATEPDFLKLSNEAQAAGVLR